MTGAGAALLDRIGPRSEPPLFAEGFFALGLRCRREGRTAEALDAFRRATELRADYTEAWFERGLLAYSHRQTAEAIGAFHAVLRRAPDHAAALANLGGVHLADGRTALGHFYLRRSLALGPSEAGAFHNYGISLLRSGQAEDAALAFRYAVQITPDSEDAHVLLATALTTSGRFDEAIAAYRRLLDRKPDHDTAALNLGALLQGSSNRALAIAAFQRAVIANPSASLALGNLSGALRGQGRTKDAIIVGRRAVAVDPGYLDGWLNLGAALMEADQPLDAAQAYREILARNIGHGDALCNLATAIKTGGNLEAATPIYRVAIAVDPGSSITHYNLATLLQERTLHAEALASYQRALRIDPAFVKAIFNLGTLHQAEGRVEEAVAVYAEALRLAPGYAEAHFNLGTAYQQQGRFDDAVVAYRGALSADPGHTGANINLGAAFLDRGQFHQAMELYADPKRLPSDPAIRINAAVVHQAAGNLDVAESLFGEARDLAPGFPQAHWNLSLVHLLRGDFERGWAEYEWRWRTSHFQKDRHPSLQMPTWLGEAGGGRTILLHAEQGLGDTIQFIRYAPLVRDRGWRVILEVQAPLVGLIRRVFEPRGIAVVPQRVDESVPYDAQCPLLSLPRAFGTTLDSVPAAVPYLAADPDAARRWRERLGAGPTVGVVWAGNPAHRNDRNRSIPIARLAPLLGIPGLRFVSLQKDPREGDREYLAANLPGFIDLGPELVDFEATAAVIEALDLVIAVDTSVAHLAGALGRPTWLLLSAPPDWRWLLGRDDSPWYPTARLFRCETGADWDRPLERLADALRTLSRVGSAASPP